jgi:hypothetical protein
MGIHTSRYSPITEVYQMASAWKESNGVAKEKGTYPTSEYQQLRYAIEDHDEARAREEYAKLKAIKPSAKIATGFKASINHSFTGTKVTDDKFEKSLVGRDRALFHEAVNRRQRIVTRFEQMFGR